MSSTDWQPTTAAPEPHSIGEHQAFIDEIARYARATRRIAVEAIGALYDVAHPRAVRLAAAVSENERLSQTFLSEMRGPDAPNRAAAPDAGGVTRETVDDIYEELREIRMILRKNSRTDQIWSKAAVILWGELFLMSLIWFLVMK